MLFTGMASPLTGAPGGASSTSSSASWSGRAGGRSGSGARGSGHRRRAAGRCAAARRCGPIVWGGMGILWLLPANRAGGSDLGGDQRRRHRRAGLAGPRAAVGGPRLRRTAAARWPSPAPSVLRHRSGPVACRGTRPSSWWRVPRWPSTTGCSARPSGSPSAASPPTPTAGPCSSCWRWPSTLTVRRPARPPSPARREPAAPLPAPVFSLSGQKAPEKPIARGQDGTQCVADEPSQSSTWRRVVGPWGRQAEGSAPSSRRQAASEMLAVSGSCVSPHRMAVGSTPKSVAALSRTGRPSPRR